MIDEIVISKNGGVVRVAGLYEKDLREFWLYDEQKANEGNIYLGKIVKKIQTANGKEGFFVDIDDDKSAFINAEEKFLENLKACEGQSVVVQVLQEKRAEKGARLTRFLQIAGKLLVYKPYGEDIIVSSKISDDDIRENLAEIVANNSETGGWTIRTAAENASEKDLISEIKLLEKEFEYLLENAKKIKSPALLMAKRNVVEDYVAKNAEFLNKVVVDNHLLEDELKKVCDVVYSAKAFDDAGIDEKLQNALQKTVKLDCGGRIVIEETKAFVAIDVDSGDITAQGGLGRLNFEAAKEIAKQIILRNLSGKIIIDFAGVSEYKFLKKSMDVLEEELSEDEQKAKVLGLSRAGNVEVIRNRKRPSLCDLLTDECSSCDGTGRVEK